MYRNLAFHEPASNVRRAVTLLELCVVLAVIALLAALLLPAVQKARDAARRAQCKSNLRQLGMAIEQYAEQCGMYPTPLLKMHATSSRNLYSQHTYILPYIEQAALFAAINFQFALYEHPNTPTVDNGTARRTRVGLFLCPSEGEPEVRNCYRYNLGLSWQAEGPFRPLEPTRPADITDGLHATAFMSERFGGTFDLAAQDRTRDILNLALGQRVSPPLQPGQARQLCETNPPAGFVPYAGRYWFYSGTYFTWYTHDAPPNDVVPSCELGTSPFGLIGLHGPRAFHGNGVNVLFGDGRVEFVSDSISEPVWRAMGTRAASD